jgi:hypothetical protein
MAVYLTLRLAFHVHAYIQIHDILCRKQADFEYESNNLNSIYFTNCKNKEGVGMLFIQLLMDSDFVPYIYIEHMPIVPVL